MVIDEWSRSTGQDSLDSHQMRAVAIQVAALALLYRVAGPYVTVPMMLYCALSFLLLRFPLFGATAASGLLSPSLRRVRVIGHRGSRLALV